MGFQNFVVSNKIQALKNIYIYANVEIYNLFHDDVH